MPIEGRKKIGATGIIIGRPHAGKSPIIQRMASQSGFKNKIVQDRRNEYPHDEWTIFLGTKYFKEKLPTFQSSFIVAEEATSWVPAQADDDFEELLIAIEHNNNIMWFAFHSWIDTPKYLLRKTRFLIALPTLDDEAEVAKARKKYLPIFQAANRKKTNVKPGEREYDDIYVDLYNF